MRELINTTLDLQAKDDFGFKVFTISEVQRKPPFQEGSFSAVGVGWGGAALKMPGCKGSWERVDPL